MGGKLAIKAPATDTAVLKTTTTVPSNSPVATPSPPSGGAKKRTARSARRDHSSDEMTYTLQEASQSLGVDVKTLKRRMERLDIKAEQDLLDKRRLLLTSAQVEELGQAYKGSAVRPGKETALGKVVRTVDAVRRWQREVEKWRNEMEQKTRAYDDVLRRYDEVLHQLEQLQQHVAQLEQTLAVTSRDR